MKKIVYGIMALAALAACTKREVVRNKQSGVPSQAVVAPGPTAVTTPVAVAAMTSAVAPTPTAVPKAAPAPDSGQASASAKPPAAGSGQASELGSLQIKDQEIGTGTEATAGHQVSVNYTGRLLTGKQFDSSIGRGPFSFKLGAGQVIKGWDLGVAGMKVGGKRQLVIPPHLAYGESGAGGVIGPNATLVFDVELLGVQ